MRPLSLPRYDVPMALASLEDVKRVLRITDDNAARDAQIQASLDAIEAWAGNVLRLAKDGDSMDVQFDINEDATLYLPSPDVVVTKVKVYGYPGVSNSIMSPVELGLGDGYDLAEGGRLILRPSLGFTPFEGARAGRILGVYSRVEIFYRGSGIVPRAVTEGIALAAAGYWQEGPTLLQGLKSEKIGDYQYTAETNNDPATGLPGYWTRAMLFLQPYMTKARVSVT